VEQLNVVAKVGGERTPVNIDGSGVFAVGVVRSKLSFSVNGGEAHFATETGDTVHVLENALSLADGELKQFFLPFYSGFLVVLQHFVGDNDFCFV
jgi:hypothetical protein